MDEIKNLQDQLDKCLEDNETLRRTFEKYRIDMAKRFDKLQKQMEEVTKETEALRKQNEAVKDENKSLERQIKALEGLNKRQLLQFTEPSNIPEPLRLNSKLLKLKSIEDAKKIHKIIDKVDHKPSGESSCSTSKSVTPEICADECNSNKSGFEAWKRSEAFERILGEPTETQGKKDVVFVDGKQDCTRDNQEAENYFDIFGPDEDNNSIEEFPGILKRSETLTSVDILERSLKNARKQVRISCSLPTNRRTSDQDSIQSEINEIENPETLDELMRRTSRSSSLTCASERFPSVLLEVLNDKKLLVKHSIISIEIEIISLELDTNSNLLLLTDKGRFIYIEYTFLGFKGHLMETQSLPLPQKSSEPVFFRFTQRFDVNPADSEEQLHILESMVASDSTKSIKFIVVDEPFGDEKGECEEIGFSFVKLNKLIKTTTEDSATVKTDVFSTSYPNDLIAFLDIKISGLSSLRDLTEVI